MNAPKQRADLGSSGRWWFGRRNGLGWFGSFDFLDLETAAAVNIFAQSQAEQGVESGLDNVGGVFGAERLAENVFDTGGFEDGADGFAGDNAGAWRGRAQEDLGAAIVSEDFMGNRGVLKRNAQHLRASQLPTFADGIGHFTGFAQTNPDATAPITDNHQGAEVEAPAAFDDLGGTINEDDFFGQFLFMSFPFVLVA